MNSEYLVDFNADSIVNMLANDNYIVVNRCLIKKIGLKESIILGELASEFNYYQKNNLLDEDGYFYSTIENIQESTSLSSYEQKKCLDNLVSMNIVDVVLKGIPAKRHIKINSAQLLNLFSKNLNPSFRKIKKLVSENLGTNNNNNNNKENINININTKERFKKPTLQEIEDYCLERHSSVNPKVFFDYFETGGWRDSKGNKVKNWKQKIITWEKHSEPKQESDVPSWFNQNFDTELTEEERKEFDELFN